MKNLNTNEDDRLIISCIVYCLTHLQNTVTKGDHIVVSIDGDSSDIKSEHKNAKELNLDEKQRSNATVMTAKSSKKEQRGKNDTNDLCADVR
jgi:hypothetical protein